jgi:hypothetical protein
VQTSRFAVLFLTTSALIAAGCGSTGGNGSSGSSHSSQAAERQIQSREKSALPKDPHFVGKPSIDVHCSASACKATLSSALATNIGLATDHWKISGGSPKLKGGSNIVGFMAADAQFQCMNHFADSSNAKALEPCARVVAHKHLP